MTAELDEANAMIVAYKEDVLTLRKALSKTNAERRELREAGERLLRVFDEFADMVVPTPDTAVYAPPLGEATEAFRTVLAKARP